MRLSDLLLVATTMTADKREMTERITRIAKPRKPGFAALIAALTLAAAVCAATFTGAATRTPEPVGETPAADVTADDSYLARGTTFTYHGVAHELGTEMIDAIQGVYPAGKYLVIDCHLGAHSGYYYIFDTETEELVNTFPGTHLIWQGDDLSTGVYAYFDNVRAYDGTTLAEFPLTLWADEIEGLRFTGGALEIEGFVEVTVNRDGRRLTTLVALDGRDMRGEFVDVLGRDGFYVNYLHETPEQNWDVRDYYTTDINGNHVLIAESMGVDYYVDLDGDGVRELVCDVKRPDGWEGTYYYRLNGELTVERAEIVNGGELTDDAYEYFATLPLKDGPLMFNGGDTMLVYSNLLRTLYVGLSENGETELPLGAGTLQGASGPENQFAICDVDGDGTDELLFRYTTTITAGMCLYVYHYNVHDGLRFEFSEYPDVTFYDNGTLTAGWSHNQVGSETIWPYHLYRYDAETDTYAQVASVLSWEKWIRGGSSPMGELIVFPDSLDGDGDGVLY